MLNIQAYHKCPHSEMCRLSPNCQGADSSRPTQFSCSFYNNGKISENSYRNPHDKTGNMIILNEDSQ